MYIALHGGEGRLAKETEEEAKRKNNGFWYGMASGLYRKNFKGGDPDHPDRGIEGAIYIAPRGIETAWDLHFQPESYVLLEQLIMTLLRPTDTPLVDSNQIFLVGFSAGGDDVYRLAANLSDRFAAVNTSAGHPGHPGEVHFQNLANLPLCSQVGEMDKTISGKKGVRALAVVGANIKLDGLEADALKKGAPGQ